MRCVKKPVALALLAVAAAAFSLSAQTSALNPTVKVLARPQSPVPAECATDLSTTAPAIEPEPQELATASIPPSNDLRASMRRLQVAAEGDDYATFKAALAEARRAAASHPPGGERSAANEALQVFTDIGRVWDYAMASAAGSFFDSSVQGGSLLGAMKRYPDYGRTIAGETLVVGDKTLYPTRETRRFLARESARRLSRLGVSTPARVAQGAQPEAWHRVTAAPPAKTKPAQVTKAKVVTPKTTETKAAPKPKEITHKPSVKIATAAPKPKPPHIESTPVPKPKPVTPPPAKIAATQTVPTPPPVVTTTTAAPTPVPVPTTTTAAVSTQPPPTTTTAAPATDTTTTTATASSSTSATDTTATAVPDTAATSTTPPPEKQNGNMNLLLAVVLILVGIGVLVVLFRASD